MDNNNNNTNHLDPYADDEEATAWFKEAFPAVAWGRNEEDPCQRGTTGCCIDHTDPDSSCETW